jgi:hypothetical protein
MRKFFRFATMALVAIAITACDKDDKKTIAPDNGGDEDYKEITVSCSIDLMAGIETVGYSMGEMSMPGDKILEFFDMTAKEFYKAMGTYTGAAGATTQVDNTIQFGVCTGNNIDKMNFCPSSSNNFGCWMTAGSAVTTWGDDAVFYHESVVEWGLEDPDEETLANMWTFGIGFYPGHNDYKAGDKVKATYFFLKEAEEEGEPDLYCYVEMIFNIVEAEEVQLNVVETRQLNYTADFDAEYIHYAIDLPVDDILAKIGVDAQSAKAYAVNPDGSFSATMGNNFWFMKDGTAGSWGTGAAICLNNNEQDHWIFCMFPDETLAGTTLNGAIAFANDKGEAYVIKVAVAVTGIDYTAINVMASYETGEVEYTLSENNLAAIYAALGVDSVDLSTVTLFGVNADGSRYDGNFTANNGYWYLANGNVSDYGTVTSDPDCGGFIEYRGENTFGCGLWRESGETSTFMIGLELGEKTCVLTFTITVDEPAIIETEQVDAVNLTASQALADGYAGELVEISGILEKLGATDITILDTEGGYDYTANSGFWFDAEGNIVGWGDAYFFVEPGYNDGGEFLGLQTGIHPDHATAGASYTATFRVADLNTMKHVTVTLTVNVTE